MSNYTLEQLQAAIGPSLRLVACAGTQKARIHRKDGRDLAVIDFEQRRIETRLTVTWDKKYLAAMTDGKPDQQTIAEAKQELVEEVIYDWELAGFNIPAEGVLERHPYPGQSNRKKPVYVVAVDKSVPTLADAVVTLRWFSDGWCTTTIEMVTPYDLA